MHTCGPWYSSIFSLDSAPTHLPSKYFGGADSIQTFQIKLFRYGLKFRMQSLHSERTSLQCSQTSNEQFFLGLVFSLKEVKPGRGSVNGDIFTPKQHVKNKSKLFA